MYRLLPISKTSNSASWEKPLPWPKGRTGSLVWLLGLLVCYQMTNQILLGSTLHGDVDDGECGFVEGQARPPWCAEAQLFRSWQAASTAEVLFDLEQVLRSDFGEEESHLLAQALPQPGEEATTTPALPAAASSTAPPPAEGSEKSPQAGNASSLRGRFEALEQALAPETRAPTDEGGGLEEASVTQKTLLEQIATARCEMCMAPHRQSYSECARFRNVSSCAAVSAEEPQRRDGLTRWMEDLLALQARLSSRKSTRHPLARGASSTKETSVIDQISSLGCEMCLEPHRRGYPQCGYFLSTPACMMHKKGEELLDARRANMSTEHRAWDAKVADHIAAFRKVLCADPSRKGDSVCAGFTTIDAGVNAGEAPPAEAKTPSLRGGSRSEGSNGAIVVHRQDVRRVWFPSLQGKIPKVACITVLPHGWGALAQVPHLVAGFRNQTYEGKSMLVLVYHFQNREAAEFLQRYADDTRILGVAARGDVSDFPSSATFRFGAWHAEKEGAEVVARWDLDAWHGPKRLAMQVRALSLSSRPACILQRWQGPRRAGAVAGFAAADGMAWGDRTLVGEAAWMRRNWFPLLARQKEKFPHLVNGKPLDEREDQRDLAVLDMPELFIFVSPDALAGAH